MICSEEQSAMREAARCFARGPERLNALNDAMKHQLSGAFQDFASDDSVRVVVISGADKAAYWDEDEEFPHSFAAGHE